MTTPHSIDPADWITLCQSELAAMAVDREFAEGLATAAQAWNTAAAWNPAPADDPPRPARTDAPPRPAPPGPAFGDGSNAPQPDGPQPRTHFPG